VLGVAKWAEVGPPFPHWTQTVDIDTIEPLLFIAGLLVALGARSARWLVALSAFSLGTNGFEALMNEYYRFRSDQAMPGVLAPTPLYLWLELGQTALAVAGGVGGLVLVKRIPTTARDSTMDESGTAV
jgi:hypothetical protein